MNKPIRVLQHVRVLDSGGIEAFIFANLRNIDRDKVIFDFLVTRDKKEFYDEEVEKLGGKKIILEFRKYKNSFLNSFSQAFAFYKFCKKNKETYRVIHFQSIGANGFFDIIAAKFAGIPIRIAHSHIAMDIKPSHNSKKRNVSWFRKQFVLIRQKLIRFFVSYNATHFFGCSKMACDWMYTKKVNKKNNSLVINNPIDTSKFIFNDVERNNIRKKLNLENKFIIGHVGRFVYSKNHEFLIDVFYQVKQKREDAILFLVGNGQLKDSIIEKVRRLGLEDSVIFYGETDEVYKLYNAFDVFVFPSHYEGLGIVLIEAQTNGLYVIASDTIPPEVKNVENFSFVSLDDGKEVWANKIIKCDFIRKNENFSKIVENGYDIKYVSKLLENKYLELHNCNKERR